MFERTPNLHTNSESGVVGAIDVRRPKALKPDAAAALPPWETGVQQPPTDNDHDDRQLSTWD